MVQGGPQYAFLPAGANDEIDLVLVPRDGLETGFVRSGSESMDSRTLPGEGLFLQ